MDEPIFTPATKAVEGHDENIDFETACGIAGDEVMEHLRDVSIRIYSWAREFAAERGILLADTKFEFGWALDNDGNKTDELLLIDGAITIQIHELWSRAGASPNTWNLSNFAARL